ncbi:class I SAM-dependent methyltransferase [Streptomyces sp. WM6372]|uniref:class I SAM-dependent methyltransferase n=1 Tax=Streptomyces sp. WM6372 TaxID=1415555 RepID=UPI0006ADDF2B|nr:class I SAM-dependent methyltransferase [Streptomyces sp. WM6372]
MNKTDLMAKAPSIAAAMAAASVGPGIQLAQTRYRAALVSGWGIPAGASVLEVGCGQGDMTAVLAEAVGPQGRVVAVDIADPSYGAPLTLGQSAKHLKATPLGSRIDFRFGLDVLDEAVTFPDSGFDYAVLAHCSWYFASLDQLGETLARVRRWARNLCFTEWDLAPRSADQLPHLLAVLIQGQIEASGSRGEGNVRTPFSHEGLLRVLAAAGWDPAPGQAVDTTALQDGDWEVDACAALLDDVDRMAELPKTVRDLVLSQADVLRSLAKDRGNTPLPAYSLTAH